MEKQIKLSNITKAELEKLYTQQAIELERVKLENTEHLKTIDWYQQRINLALNESYGKKLSKILFNEVEHLSDEKVEEPTIEDAVKEVKNKTEKRKYKKNAKSKKRNTVVHLVNYRVVNTTLTTLVHLKQIQLNINYLMITLFVMSVVELYILLDNK